jgi:hypothetical protein
MRCTSLAWQEEQARRSFLGILMLCFWGGAARFLTDQVTRTCIGYLEHPFKNKPFETEKELLSLLANTGGSV